MTCFCDATAQKPERVKLVAATGDDLRTVGERTNLSSTGTP
ncbi:hypothetical protein Ae356Ps1_3395 [Pseudonocardia sp. Ae356_Ps1]|nr:hypothetical protein Ae150APs1_1806 [Pseudonocardia sp. Ae150A_Ps1]OLL93498.1 hypothetical protein Ae356Ps1_3395 [Pseudonocardia sp. Ae356_Ps1]